MYTSEVLQPRLISTTLPYHNRIKVNIDINSLNSSISRGALCKNDRTQTTPHNPNNLTMHYPTSSLARECVACPEVSRARLILYSPERGNEFNYACKIPQKFAGIRFCMGV